MEDISTFICIDLAYVLTDLWYSILEYILVNLPILLLESI